MGYDFDCAAMNKHQPHWRTRMPFGGINFIGYNFSRIAYDISKKNIPLRYDARQFWELKSLNTPLGAALVIVSVA